MVARKCNLQPENSLQLLFLLSQLYPNLRKRQSLKKKIDHNILTFLFSFDQDQIEDAGHDEVATRDVSSKMKNHTIIPLLPLKNSIFVHDALAAQLMYLVT